MILFQLLLLRDVHFHRGTEPRPISNVRRDSGGSLILLINLATFNGAPSPLELAAEDLLLAGEVDDALLHPRELRRQELLELGTLGVDRRVGAAKYISIFTKLFVHIQYEQDMMVKVKVVLLKCIPMAGPQGNLPPQ